MPLLKRKPFALLPPPAVDVNSKDARQRQVWYSSITKEIFTDYSTYLQRSMLYRQPIWQCESTGKINLTFKEALESERIEKERVQDKMSKGLQRRVLKRAQFQTSRLDSVVEDVYNYFLERYAPGETVNCVWDDGVAYNARILQVHPPQGSQLNDDDAETRYKVQLIDDQSACIKGYEKMVTKAEIKRDRLAFSKNLLKKFLRECLTKDSYIGAPWQIKENVAARFGLSTTMPHALQRAKDEAYAKSKKRRSAAAMDIKEKSGTSSILSDARKLEASLKYPMEDLDLPSYRRDPSGSGPVIDMTPGQPDANSEVPNPTGDMPVRPPSIRTHTIPASCFGSFLMIYSFLNTFARPLGLYPFSMDDFEHALRHDDQVLKSQLLIETNASLLNAIIRTRQQAKSSAASAATSVSAASGELNGEPQIAVSSTPRRVSLRDRGCGSPKVNAICPDWDKQPIPVGNDREGWQDVLIGCVNEMATPDIIPELDVILSQLVPPGDSTPDDREAAYLKLKLKDKVLLLDLLVNLANECTPIKEYMEECQEQMTELRKQKIDLSRERKRIYAERLELEKRSEEAHDTENEMVPDSPGLDMSEEEASDHSHSRTSETRLESRQETLKRKQAERQEQEAKRLKMYHHQRQKARARQHEIKMRAELRKKLNEEERLLRKREEQVEQNMRRFSTLRIKPLGRDKFYNRYYYFDNVGGANAHGSGKLFVQSPSAVDVILLKARDDPQVIDPTAPPCGRGGGMAFVCQLMKAQGMEEQAKWLEEQDEHPDDSNEWWETYEEPEELEQLLAWLNPKGVREYKLKRELDKLSHMITNGMKRRSSEQNASKIEVPRRSTRSRTVPAVPAGSWLAYTNKYAK